MVGLKLLMGIDQKHNKIVTVQTQLSHRFIIDSRIVTGELYFIRRRATGMHFRIASLPYDNIV